MALPPYACSFQNFAITLSTDIGYAMYLRHVKVQSSNWLFQLIALSPIQENVRPQLCPRPHSFPRLAPQCRQSPLLKKKSTENALSLATRRQINAHYSACPRIFRAILFMKLVSNWDLTFATRRGFARWIRWGMTFLPKEPWRWYILGMKRRLRPTWTANSNPLFRKLALSIS